MIWNTASATLSPATENTELQALSLWARRIKAGTKDSWTRPKTVYFSLLSLAAVTGISLLQAWARLRCKETSEKWHGYLTLPRKPLPITMGKVWFAGAFGKLPPTVPRAERKILTAAACAAFSSFGGLSSWLQGTFDYFDLAEIGVGAAACLV